MFINLKDTNQKEIVPGFSAKFVHSENMTFAYWDIEAGSELPEHSHPHEQVLTVIKGKLVLTIEGKTQILEPGSVAVIPANAKHSGKAITECRCIDVFYPVREDFRDPASVGGGK